MADSAPLSELGESAVFDRTQTEFPRSEGDSVSSPSGCERSSAERSSDGSIDRRAATNPGREEVMAVDQSDRYFFASEHARGGLGRVVKAEDQRLQRTVAIKELLKKSDFAESLFVREALITARLQHPGIVPVHDAGRWPTGEPYYVMKMVSGTTLKKVIRGRPTLGDRLSLLSDVIAVGETIAYAHSEGVLHRDIKPANVIVGEFGETVVVDWGLAADRRRNAASPAAEKVVDAALASTKSPGSTQESGEYSVSGKVIGTPAYMSPEQARGDEVDERSDIYALGALLYEVLAGQAPYPGEVAREILDLVRAGPPRPLEERVPDVPPDLSTIVTKAMARDPAERYASAKLFTEDLKRFQTGGLVRAHEYSTFTLVRRWMWRHRGAVGVALAGVIIMAVMAVLGIRQIVEQRNQARSQRAQAELARKAAEERRNDLLLLQSQSSLVHDPTETLAWLKQVPLTGANFTRARAMADEAVASGVAKHVFVHDRMMLNVWFTPDGEHLISQSGDRKIRGYDLGSGAVRVIATIPEPGMWSELSPDGRYLATAGSATIRLWELASGTMRAYPGAARQIRRLEFAADGGELIITTQTDRQFWNLATDEIRVIDTAASHWKAAGIVDVSLDGKLVAAPSANREIVLFQAADATELRRIPLPFQAGWVAFLPDHRHLLVHGDDETMYLLEREGGRIHELGRQSIPPRRVDFSVSGRYAATVGVADRNAYLWDIAKREGRVLSGNRDQIYHVAFSGDESTVATAGDDGSVRVWDLDSQQSWVLRGHKDDVFRVALAADGRRVVSASLDGSIRTWELQRGNILHAGGENPGDLSFRDDGSLLSYARGSGLRIWDLDSGRAEMIGRLRGKHNSFEDSTAISANRAHVAAILDNHIQLWNLPEKRFRELAAGDAAVMRLAFSPDSDLLASVDGDGKVLLWDLATQEPMELLRDSDAHNVAFVLGGSHLAVARSGHRIQLWELSSRRVTGEISYGKVGPGRIPRWVVSSDGTKLAGHTSAFKLVLVDVADETVSWLDIDQQGVSSMLFSPDGSRLASAVGDRRIRIWNTSDGSEARVITGHRDLVFSMAFSPDGSTLASASHDQTIRLWNLESGDSRVLRGHNWSVESVAFSPSGRTLVSSSPRDGTIRVWDVSRDPIDRPEMLRRVLDESTTAVIGADDCLITPTAE